MTIRFNNPLLSSVMHQLRRTRPRLSAEVPFYNRVEKSHGGNYVEVWFLTSGCQWDARGSCTMCNYGQGPNRTEDEIVEAVRQGLAAIDVDVRELVVSPSGSMLDPLEVPINARRRIYTLINDFPAPKFTFETRAETVNGEAIKEFVESIPGKQLGVEIGLESSNGWIQRFCVNKGSHPKQFIEASRILTSNNINVYANISLGTAFLNPGESIKDALDSTRWALTNGADIAVLFPIHVKPYTLLAWLYQKGLYRPPSLWSLVEVLYQLGPELMSRTEISWYRNYYNDPSKVIASPTTCNRCQEEVLGLLDEYRNFQSPSVINQLRGIQCECKDAWKEEINNSPTLPLPYRVLETYRELANYFLPDNWWSLHNSTLQHELLNSYFATPGVLNVD